MSEDLDDSRLVGTFGSCKDENSVIMLSALSFQTNSLLILRLSASAALCSLFVIFSKTLIMDIMFLLWY